MPDLRLFPTALRELGPLSLLQYGRYQVELRSGWLRRRTPSRAWDGRPLQAWGAEGFETALRARAAFFFEPAADLSDGLKQVLHGGSEELIRQAEAILQGRFTLFGTPGHDLGFPPDWNRFPRDAAALPAAALPVGRHWSAYPTNGDTDWRSLWELSRFQWVFALARAYRLTGNAKYWDGCWALLDSWRTANPPNTGPQWISGQEVGMRILALAFAWYAFAPALREQHERAAAILEMAEAHAARIPPTLSYARAQRNNHLLSEAVGLYTAGALFPELRGASRWKRTGTRWLAAALKDQVFPDGGYIQHSVNYQRLALSLGLWAHGLAQAQGAPLSPETTEALRRMAGCLTALVEPGSGKAPRFGHDDGSQLLPLSTCDHGDLRPLLQAAARALSGQPAFPPGRWDELSFWLGGSQGVVEPGAAVAGPEARGTTGDFPHAGLYLLRGRHSRAVLRCGRFRSRPGHSDQLHLDLWWEGINLAVDPGSYRYAGSEPGDHALGQAMAHNGPMVAGWEPMRRAGRFLWLDWAQGQLLGRWRSPSGGLEVLAAEHDGYRRQGWTCRRTVVRAGEAMWLVVDELLGGGEQSLQVAWTLPDGQVELRGSQLRRPGEPQGIGLSIEPETAELGLYRAGELQGGASILLEPQARVLGWYSPTYGSLQPAATLVSRLHGELPLRMISRWSLGEAGWDALQLEWAALGAPGLPFTWVQWGDQEIRL